ncbi:hypothetical protein Misp02_10760 [Microtetraspora sp. NBRC 16547]|nr:hypothetical protein Misp02_10760 [Microtetraspora sp. NBRC 16547]
MGGCADSATGVGTPATPSGVDYSGGTEKQRSTVSRFIRGLRDRQIDGIALGDPSRRPITPDQSKAAAWLINRFGSDVHRPLRVEFRSGDVIERSFACLFMRNGSERLLLTLYRPDIGGPPEYIDEDDPPYWEISIIEFAGLDRGSKPTGTVARHGFCGDGQYGPFPVVVY